MKISKITCCCTVVLGFFFALSITGCETAPSATDGEAPPAHIPPARTPQPRPVSKLKALSSSVQVGDTLELFVKEDDSFNGKYVVRERGDIILPSVGRIPVKGLSVTAVGKKVKSALEQNLLTKATVIADRTQRAKPKSSPSNAQSNNAKASSRKILVYITGKVSRPGQHKLTVPENHPLGVYEAILIAGGITRFGDEQKVHVLRTGADGKKHRIPVNIRSISNGKAKDPAIGEGDIVVVPEKVFGF